MTDQKSKFSKFTNEIKRRKVVRVIILYATTAFIILQVVDLLISPLQLPKWIMPLVIVLLIVGFPIAIILAWAYQLNPKNEIKTDIVTD